MSVHKVGDNGARESLVLGVVVKTYHNILDGRSLPARRARRLDMVSRLCVAL